MTSKLDSTVEFLAKREGIDKTLKIVRYTTRLLLATALADSKSELAIRLSDFESSVGTSRKAYRLGKFLQNINAIRKHPVSAPHAKLHLIANAGEFVYYFTEQFQWLVKAGLLPERYSRPLGKISAMGELIGYIGSVWLGVLRIQYLLDRENELEQELERRRVARGGGPGSPVDEKDIPLLEEIKMHRAKTIIRKLKLIQDFADALMAVADLRGGRGGGGVFANRTVLASAGLVSGCLSAYKNWPGMQK